MQDILTDTPLENPADDRLGYAPFAKSLAEAICKFNDDEGLVFALFAPWGSGKTTCLNFIQYYIDAEKGKEKPLIVRFNPFDMPLPDKISVRKLFFETLDKVFAGTPEDLFDQTYFGNVFWDGIDHFLKTVRNVKRLTNALKITYPSVVGEVNPVDFLAIETIRVFLPDIYYLIRSNSEMFSGHSDRRGYFGPGIEEIKRFHNHWLEQLPENEKGIVKKLMLRIFPKLRAVFDNNFYGPDWEATWRKQLRICSPDKFPIYFKFAIPEGQISNIEMKTFLALAVDKNIFCKLLLELANQHCLDGRSRASVFLERMEDYTEKEIPKDHLKNILLALFDVGDHLLLPEDESRGFFSFGNDVRLGRIMFQLLKRYDNQQERYEILSEAFINGSALSTIVREIAVLSQQHGKLGTDADDEKERLVGAGN